MPSLPTPAQATLCEPDDGIEGHFVQNFGIARKANFCQSLIGAPLNTAMYMCKLLFIPLLAALALAVTARDTLAGETPAAALRPDGAAPLSERITTLDGKTYEKVVLD